MKVKDLLAMDICVDVACSLTEIGMDVFKEALDLEVKLTTPSDVLILCKDSKEAEIARELFESLAGYCTENEWELWFEEV